MGEREAIAEKLYGYNAYIEKLWIPDPSAPYEGAVKWNDEAALTIADAILGTLRRAQGAQEPVAWRYQPRAPEGMTPLKTWTYCADEPVDSKYYVKEPLYASPTDAGMRERALAEIERLRVLAATDFTSENCRGQRGQDRCDALYDAYQAVKALSPTSTDGKGGA